MPDHLDDFEQRVLPGAREVRRVAMELGALDALALRRLLGRAAERVEDRETMLLYKRIVAAVEMGFDKA